VSATPSDEGSYAGELSLSDNGAVAAFRTFRNPIGVIQVGPADVSDAGTPSTDPSVSDNGARVAYTQGDAVVVTSIGGATSPVGAGNGVSGEAALSGNGKVVAFTTYATDLGVGDGNGTVGDIIVRAI
jgi:hypothetical protein